MYGMHQDEACDSIQDSRSSSSSSSQYESDDEWEVERKKQAAVMEKDKKTEVNAPADIGATDAKNDANNGDIFEIEDLSTDEGIYLDDPHLEDMDDETPKLYFPKRFSHSIVEKPDHEDDVESGRGASLPQSPVPSLREAFTIIQMKSELDQVKRELEQQKEMAVKYEEEIKQLRSQVETLRRQPHAPPPTTQPQPYIEPFYHYQLPGPHGNLSGEGPTARGIARPPQRNIDRYNVIQLTDDVTSLK